MTNKLLYYLPTYTSKSSPNVNTLVALVPEYTVFRHKERYSGHTVYLYGTSAVGGTDNAVLERSLLYRRLRNRLGGKLCFLDR